MRSSRTWLPLIVGAIALVAIACGSVASSGPSSTAANTATSPTPTVIADGITVTAAWVRPPIGPDRPAAGYLTITNTSTQEDALIGVSTPIATSVEIHQTMADDSGMMAMQPLASLRIPAGLSKVTFEPGGYHLMLMGVAGMPPVGGTVELTLTFQHAGDIVVQAEVRAG